MLRPLIYETTIPVELVSFNASLNQSNVSLSWTTATELNNRGFSVQRKVENKWQDVGFVEGNGTTTEINSYSYIDDISSIESFGKIYYRLKQIDYDGSFSMSSEVLVMMTPAEYKLSQNYPNPFNPVTRINFQLPYASNVTLKIYDVVGSEVATLVNEIKAAGNYNFDFNASSLASGVYYYKLQAGDFVQNKKMILMK
ncbi:MAG: T9SS C-terminal target domain-containing protein [Ignavibacteriales bacterium]|nr:MAG: T9SS C-terminal target domain-containing protein [Ignavibacteriales bacterium]